MKLNNNILIIIYLINLFSINVNGQTILNLYVDSLSTTAVDICGSNTTVACPSIQDAINIYNLNQVNGEALNILLAVDQNQIYTGLNNTGLSFYNMTVTIGANINGSVQNATIDLQGSNSSFITINEPNGIVDRSPVTTLVLNSLSIKNGLQQGNGAVIQINTLKTITNVLLQSSMFSNNTAIGNGAIVYLNPLSINVTTVNISNCVMTNNTAADGTVISGSTGNAGGTFFNVLATDFNSQIALAGSIISSNRSNLYMADSTFTGCQASKSIIENYEGGVSIQTTQFLQTSATLASILVVRSTTSNLYQVDFEESNGTILKTAETSMTISTSSFVGTNASQNGVFLFKNSAITMNTVTIDNSFGSALGINDSVVDTENITVSDGIADNSTIWVDQLSSIVFSKLTLTNNHVINGGNQSGVVSCQGNSSIDFSVVSSTNNTNGIQLEQPIVTCFNQSSDGSTIIKSCHIVGLEDEDDQNSLCSFIDSSDNDNSYWTVGKITGLVFGIFLGLALLSCVGYVFYKRHKNTMQYRSF